jgi:hypothetical protein
LNSYGVEKSSSQALTYQGSGGKFVLINNLNRRFATAGCVVVDPFFVFIAFGD